MKRFTGFLKFALPALFAVSLVACDKDNNDNDEPVGKAKVAVTHAAAGAAAVDVYVDGNKATTTQLAFGQTTGTSSNPYLSVDEGTRNIKVSADGTTNVIDSNVTLDKDKNYSVFAYGPLVNNKLNSLILTDDFTAPAENKAHIRFLHLSPDAQAVDIVLIPAMGDSTVISNVSYVGTSPNAATLSAFTPVAAGSYNVKIKLAGTETNVFPAPIPFVAANGKIYTVYAKGLISNQPPSEQALSASVITHN